MNVVLVAYCRWRASKLAKMHADNIRFEQETLHPDLWTDASHRNMPYNVDQTVAYWIENKLLTVHDIPNDFLAQYTQLNINERNRVFA